MNNENEKFSNPLVRQAVSYVIDKEGALLAVKEGNGTVAQNFLINGLFGYDDSVKAPDMDVEKAKELMAQAGAADGFTPRSLRRMVRIRSWHRSFKKT
jgi:peptide/nickel transport system substrate-binding protein